MKPEPLSSELPPAGLPQEVVAVLRDLLPPPGDGLALHEPRFAGREWDYVKDCIDSGWVSSAGAYVDRFEAELAEVTGAGHAIACMNGTAALHLGLQLAGVERGDEVLLPALTFVASANAAAYIGAVPHFVDSEETTLGLDPQRLAAYLKDIATFDAEGRCRNRATGRRIAAVVPMHTFGHPVDMDPLLELAAKTGIAVVEDAAEALGSTYKGRGAGSLAPLAALSFNGNKIATTGGGGALLTDDAELAARARHLTTTAKRAHAWAYEHDEIGYNYRMPNLNAALGCAQLEQLPGFLAAKRELAARYAEAFAGLAGARFFTEQGFARSNYWLNLLLLDETAAADDSSPDSSARDAVLAASNAAGYRTRPAWNLMPSLPMYKDCPRMDLAVAESLARRIVNLPSSAILGTGIAHAR